MKFSIEEIKNYIVSQDSLGDVLHFLNEENVINANKDTEAPNRIAEILQESGITKVQINSIEYEYRINGAVVNLTAWVGEKEFSDDNFPNALYELREEVANALHSLITEEEAVAGSDFIELFPEEFELLDEDGDILKSDFQYLAEENSDS